VPMPAPTFGAVEHASQLLWAGVYRSQISSAGGRLFDLFSRADGAAGDLWVEVVGPFAAAVSGGPSSLAVKSLRYVPFQVNNPSQCCGQVPGGGAVPGQCRATCLTSIAALNYHARAAGAGVTAHLAGLEFGCPELSDVVNVEAMSLEHTVFNGASQNPSAGAIIAGAPASAMLPGWGAAASNHGVWNSLSTDRSRWAIGSVNGMVCIGDFDRSGTLVPNLAGGDNSRGSTALCTRANGVPALPQVHALLDQLIKRRYQCPQLPVAGTQLVSATPAYYQ